MNLCAERGLDFDFIFGLWLGMVRGLYSGSLEDMLTMFASTLIMDREAAVARGSEHMDTAQYLAFSNLG
jgi:hypothetical protein